LASSAPSKNTHLTIAPLCKENGTSIFILFVLYVSRWAPILDHGFTKEVTIETLHSSCLLHLVVVVLAVSVDVSWFFVKSISVFLGVSSTHQNFLLPHTVSDL
jgi:hypothetical protein